MPKADAGTACTMVHWYKDSDNDTYGDPAMVQDACAAPFGYVSSSTDCDDTSPTRHPGAPELCNTVDDNCDGTVNGSVTEAAGCEAAKGSFDGGFRMYTAEKLGSSVINEMPCNGGESIKIDPAATPVVSGNVVCTYNGGLTAFGHTQYGTIAGTLGVDGKLNLVLDYGFSSASADRRQFKVNGTEAAGGLDGGGTGSWYPNQQSAVPWVVDISLSGVKH